MVYDNSIFGNINFFAVWRLETRFPHIGKMRNFLYVTYIPYGNVRERSVL